MLVARSVLAAILIAVSSSANSADQSSRPKDSYGACGDKCVRLDNTVIQCGSTERPVYDDEGECDCEFSEACESKSGLPQLPKRHPLSNVRTQPVLLFDDDFSSQSGKWTAFGGVWTYSPGLYTGSVSAPNNQAFFTEDDPKAQQGDFIYTNISLNCRDSTCAAGVVAPFWYKGALNGKARYYWLEAVINGDYKLSVKQHDDGNDPPPPGITEKVLATIDVKPYLQLKTSFDLSFYFYGAPYGGTEAVYVEGTQIWCQTWLSNNLPLIKPAVTAVSTSSSAPLILHEFSVYRVGPARC